MPADPVARERHDCSRRPFGHDEFGRVARFAKAIVVDVEALVQAEARVQRERSDKRPGRVSRLSEEGCGRARIRGQSVAAVVAQPMLERIQTRQDRGVRRQRDYGVGVGEVEAHTFASESIEAGVAARPP